MIMRELYDPMPGLVGDQYGNYVVQHVMQYGERHDRARVMEIVLPELEQFSMQKCASNVVEKCLTHGTNEWRRAVLESLMLGKRNGESMLSILIRDQYGNYVIRKSYSLDAVFLILTVGARKIVGGDQSIRVHVPGRLPRARDRQSQTTQLWQAISFDREEDE